MAQSILGGVLSFVAEGVIIFAPDGTITLINPHASLLLDYTSDDLIGKRIDDTLALTFDFSPLESEERITYQIFTARKVFTVPPGKVAHLTSWSGNNFPIFISARSIKFENSEIGLLVFRDISNEKKLENYKTNTAKRLSELTPFLQRTAVGNFSDTPEISYQEDEFTELFVGLRLMIEDLREADVQREREQAEKITVVKKTEEERRKLAEEYSKKLGKQVEEKTREIIQSKAHIETIIENLTDGLLEYDNDFTLLRMNRAAEMLLGIDREEVVGKEVLPKDIDTKNRKSLIDVSYPALASATNKVKRNLTKFNAEINEMTISYPLERELQIITVPITDQTTKEQQGFIKLVRDVTREKNIARSKSEFISIAAHQLRTPLSAVKWTLHMILNGDEGPINSSQYELLSNGYETNEKMIQLVNDLLNVARIEEGRFGYDFKQNDIMKTIEGVVELMKISARERGVAISITMPKENPPLFVFDANKVALALQNLVDNSIKYTLAGGKVSIEINIHDGFLEIHVRDTGIGIPKEQMNMLFTKFFRANNALHIQTGGSGLGLYLAKNVAVRHGGSLHVESQEGTGSVFSFSLPLDAQHIPKDDALLDDV